MFHESTSTPASRVAVDAGVPPAGVPGRAQRTTHRFILGHRVVLRHTKRKTRFRLPGPSIRYVSVFRRFLRPRTVDRENGPYRGRRAAGDFARRCDGNLRDGRAQRWDDQYQEHGLGMRAFRRRRTNEGCRQRVRTPIQTKCAEPDDHLLYLQQQRRPADVQRVRRGHAAFAEHRLDRRAVGRRFVLRRAVVGRAVSGSFGIRDECVYSRPREWRCNSCFGS